MLYLGPVAMILVAIGFALFYGIVLFPKNDPRDMKRKSDMKIIFAALESYGKDHRGVFPESLEVLLKEKYLLQSYIDPETEKPYQYVLDGGNNYSVCTYFANHSHTCLSTNAKKVGF